MPHFPRSRVLRPLTLLFVLAVGSKPATAQPPAADTRIDSSIEHTASGQRILLHRFEVAAPVERVWKAYTTAEGWRSWAAPLAEVDLRVGGSILTHYDPAATIGDPGTNRLEIVNFVPERLLTLQADLSENWPEVLKEDAEGLYNVILFESRGEGTTAVESYGLGYRDRPEYDDLLGFFRSANERLLEGLVQILEAQADG